jgi:polyvinyl alcohol dehydrogenase (cytochrome)
MRMIESFGIWSRLLSIVFVSLLLGIPPISSSAEQVSEISETNALSTGESLFREKCLACHSLGVFIPTIAGLTNLSRHKIYETMRNGIMRDPAAGLNNDQLGAIADYLTSLKSNQSLTSTQPSQDRLCKQPLPLVKSISHEWTGWAPDNTNTRFLNDAKLNPKQVRNLQLKWAFVFPDTATTLSSENQPTVSNGLLYISSRAGIVYALDAYSGCIHWSFEADAGIRSAIVVADQKVLFGDYQANVYALDAIRGDLIWKSTIDKQATARVSGNITVNANKVFIPVSSMQETYGAHKKLPCCRFRGSVVALDLANGERIWKTYMIDTAATEIGTTILGIKRYGPSGVPVWSVPTVDVGRNLLYISTGNQYTEPVVAESDAILALDLSTGEKRWLRNFAPEHMNNQDVYHFGCEAWVDETRSTCSPINPKGQGDREFGAPVVLTTLDDGSELLLAGSKDGMMYALDPDHDGNLIWEKRLGRGGELGGIQYGFATDGERAFIPISDVNADFKADGALISLDIKTGKINWRIPSPNDTCEDKPAPCNNALTAAVTLTPQIVFAGSIDGYLRAYQTHDGQLIWEYDTTQLVKGVNGLDGHGGSIGTAGPTITGNMLYQTSGYGGILAGMPGNVLLAFEFPAE